MTARDTAGSALEGLEIDLADGRPAIARVHGVRPEHAASWLTEHAPAVRAALERHGSLLIRGLGLSTVEYFAAARDVLLTEPVAYQEKATPRSEQGSGVYSSTDMPPSHEIALHNENSYTLDFPGLLLFGCLTAPEQGGATPVADCRKVLARIPEPLADRFRASGWTLTRTYHPHMGLPWTRAFGTEDRAQLESYLGRSLTASQWLAGDTLRTSQRRTATLHHPDTGEEVWFNHIAFWNEHTLDPEFREVLRESYGPEGLPFNTAHGDGSPIAPEDVAVLAEAYRAERCRESWQPGDLLIVDNILTCHGREAFRGDRRIVVAMGRKVSLAQCAPAVAAAPGALR